MEQVLIDGEWRNASEAGAFNALDPTTGEDLPETFPISTMEDVEAALDAGRGAVRSLRSVPRAAIADFLLAFADRIEAASASLVEAAHRETALPAEPRLASIELPRTVDQIRQAAKATRDGTWTTATIDSSAGIRSMFGPLGGPVAVFGPNNFPFAFNSASGGDFAAAIAAGNPVIAKANTSHPMTTMLLAREAFAAVRDTGLPKAMVQLIYRLGHEDGIAFAGDRKLGAVGFTGSRSSGLALKSAADASGVPIYLEMSSVNPVFVLRGALSTRAAAIANEFYRSCTLGVGQFCTSPGIVVVPAGREADAFVDLCENLFLEDDAGVLLGSPDHIARAVSTLESAGAEVLVGGAPVGKVGFNFASTLLTTTGVAFLANPGELQTEAFGPVSLIVRAHDIEEMVGVASALDGSLTGSIYADEGGSDRVDYEELEPELREKVGRLLNDKMPTGVAVSPAMNHGGPYPSTGHPGFTAVGIPASIHRFAALHSYDNVSQERLPPELRDENPNGTMYRLIDGCWSQSDVPSDSSTVHPV
ncbi:MAG: aldehyde dehydrogenase family protein [Acidimicrobiia bacterium]|nr:MAG: aldehyde dehydrogenase family protein [Acidimicrobiia bacterium]